MLLPCIYTILTAKKNILTIDFKGKRELALFYIFGKKCLETFANLFANLFASLMIYSTIFPSWFSQ